MLKPVVTAITCAIMIIMIVPNKPALPTTQPKRIYIITPKMVNIDGVKTPSNVLNFFVLVISFVFFMNVQETTSEYS